MLEQAQIFLTAAACTAAGFFLLYLALGLYGMILDKALRLIGVHGALTEYIFQAVRRKPWWQRLGTWYTRTFQR